MPGTAVIMALMASWPILRKFSSSLAEPEKGDSAPVMLTTPTLSATKTPMTLTSTRPSSRTPTTMAVAPEIAPVMVLPTAGGVVIATVPTVVTLADEGAGLPSKRS